MAFDDWKLSEGDPLSQEDAPRRCEACRERDHDLCDGRECQCDCREEDRDDA